MSRRSPLAALRRDRTVQVVAAVAVLALLARLFALGARVAHQDEARVGYWTVRYAVSGVFEYRSIVHGPFIPIVNSNLFSLFGATDFVSRLPMAVLGALAPISALLYRTRLRDSETVAFGALLAANPVLLYYSRFMRQDVPLAVFVLFALGFAIRAIDAEKFRTRRRYVLAAAFAFGLACTTKENVLLYPMAWLGAAALVWDQSMLRSAAGSDDSVLSAVWDWVGRVGFRRVVGAVALLVANPGTLTIIGVPTASSGSGSTAAFVALSAAAVVGYGLAVDSPNPLHYLAVLPMAVLAGIALLGAAFPGLSGGTVLGSIAYVFERFLVYYAVSWLLAVVLLFDRAVISRSPIRRFGADATGAPTRPDPESETAELEGDGTGVGPDDEGPVNDSGDPADGNVETPLDDEHGPHRDDTWSGRHWFLPPMLAAFVVFFVVVIFFYAPRGGGYPDPAGSADGVGLYSALGSLDFVELNYVVWEATVGTWLEFLANWGGEQAEHPYIPYFTDFAKTIYVGALTLSVAAGAGLLLDRYGEGGPRDFVSFCGFWGIASVVGYPLVTDIAAPWVTVHAIVPLAVPAAVAIAFVVRWGAKALSADDASGVAIAALVLLAAVGQVGYAAAGGVYLSPQSENNELVQYAQSSSTDLKAALGDVRAIAREHEGTDLLYYGNELDSNDESDNDQPFAGGGWFDRLPIAWYTEAWTFDWRDGPATVEVNSTGWSTRVEGTEAPVVVALGDRKSGEVVCEADAIDEYLEGYRKYCGKRYLYDSGTTATVVMFVETEWLDRIDDPADVYQRLVFETPETGNATDGRVAAPPIGPLGP
jgi:predicted membrane-bound mannosyltransferase